MKFIRKNSTPTCLTNYIRNNPNATYIKFKRSKTRYNDVKKSLTEEQGFICCYCGRRITGNSDTQIEHLYAKGISEYKEMQLDYETNLLACCDGGKSEKSNRLISSDYVCCEAIKGTKILPINPLIPLCEGKFMFAEKGEIIGVSKDAEVTVKILNLTSPYITNLRKAAIASLNLYPPSNWQNEFDRLNNFNSNGMLEEFCFVLRSYIYCYHL